MITTARSTGRRSWLLFAVALLVALIICGWQAVAILRFRSPTPDQTVGIGQTIIRGGVSFRLDTFEVATSFPPAQEDQDPASPLPGATFVRIIFTEEVVDADRDLTTIFCDLSVNSPDGRRWTTSDLAYRVELPEALTCSGSSDNKAKLHVPFQVGALFMVPESSADQLTFRIRLSTERQLIEFTR